MDALIAMHEPPTPRARGRRRAGGMGMLAGALLLTGSGCRSDTTGPALVPGAQLFWALSVDRPALNLALNAPYDTVQLQATATTATGAALTGAGHAVFSTRDSSITVTPEGLVTARYVTNGVPAQLSVTLTEQGETLVNTVYVTVNSIGHPLTLFSIQPQPDGIDSAAIAVDRDFRLNQYNGNIPVYVTDTQGDTLCDAATLCPLEIVWSSSDPTIATIDNNGIVTTLRPGRVVFAATTYAYGTVRRDTLPFKIGYPLSPYSYSNIVSVLSNTPIGSTRQSLFFYPASLTVGVGGGVAFGNFSNQFPIDVVFDDSSAVAGFFGGPSGNIPADTASDVEPRMRAFPVAGTYHFHSRLYSTSGTIIVSSGP